MEHDLLEGGTTLGDDQESNRGTPRDEGLLDRPAAGNDLLIGPERLR